MSAPPSAQVSSMIEAVQDRILDVRDRLVTSPRFQRWAARFPLTRPIARRHAQAAFDLCAGFVYSQVLHACVTLGVLQRVQSGPLPEAALVRALALPDGRGELLVNAAAALGLLQRRSGGRIGLGMRGGAIVANPGIIAMVEHHSHVYCDLADPAALLNGQLGDTALKRFWPYAERVSADIGGASAARYSDLMSISQDLISDDVLGAYDLGRHRAVLDVGGGDGTFLRAVAGRHPSLRLCLFDLPPVAERALERLGSAGLAERIKIVGGSFIADELPTGYDLVSLVRVMHDHDDDRVLDLLRRVRRCMEPGATLLIAEPMSIGSETAKVADVYFAFYLLAMGSGRARTLAEISRLLRLSGFGDAVLVRSLRPLLVSIATAKAQ